MKKNNLFMMGSVCACVAILGKYKIHRGWEIDTCLLIISLGIFFALVFYAFMVAKIISKDN